MTCWGWMVQAEGQGKVELNPTGGCTSLCLSKCPFYSFQMDQRDMITMLGTARGIWPGFHLLAAFMALFDQGWMVLCPHYILKVLVHRYDQDQRWSSIWRPSATEKPLRALRRLPTVSKALKWPMVTFLINIEPVISLCRPIWALVSRRA